MQDALPGIKASRLCGKFVVWFCALTCVMVLTGLLVTRVLGHVSPMSAEDGIDRLLAAHRTGWANDASGELSTIGNTVGAATAAIIAMVLARWICGRWHESLYFAFAAVLEVAVFLVTTLVVHRPRPGVPELDHSPPTSSFPSGHTAAALALYGAAALLIARRTRRRGRRRLPWLLLLVPIAIGVARLYRGMHHPSDVVAGALLGALCVAAAWHSVLRGPAMSEVPEP